MTTVAAVVALVLAASVAAAIWYRITWQERHPAIGRRVLISLEGEAAGVRGLIRLQRGEFLIVSAAEVCAAGEEPTRVGGDLILERRRILWVQLLSR